MAQQLIEQPGRLTKLIGAMVLKEMARKALLKAVDSFVCRGVKKSEWECLKSQMGLRSNPCR